ncbi:MAG: histidinol phosphate aminotransferase apoenzyme [Ramlibacter sp.]|nr:histidinol phosphate aminotransferase apoenzyme [Ramlibacter sp.]
MSGRAFWSPRVRELVPYVPGEQPRIANLVKLNTNENPYPPSPRVTAAIADAASKGLELYPDPESTILRETIADYHGIDPGQVFPGNGSDEVLAHSFFAFFQQDRPLLMPDVTYSFYRVYCQLYGIQAQLLAVDEALQIDVAGYRGRRAGGVVIANPNAPTGSALPLTAVEQLLQSQPDCVVLVDEAYVDFGAESAIPLVDRYPNLLVVQTLSKSRSLAGLRVGFAVGQRHLIEALERVKNSFNSYPLDRLAVAGAVAAYEDREHFEQTRQTVMRSRDELTVQMWRLGFDVLPSSANFVFARHPKQDAAALAARLREHGVLVRHFSQPRIAQYLRISVGTPVQCDALVNALRLLIPAD